MKSTTSFTAAVITFLSGSFFASCAFGEVYGIAATVNGKPITSGEVREAVEAQSQMIRMTIKDPVEAARRLDTLGSRALDALIERQLVLSEFEKIGGSIKPEYVDDEIKKIVLDSFKGDRDKFIAELAKSGMTLKRFRELQEKLIVVQVMKQRQMQNLAPPTPAQVDGFYEKHSEKFRDKDFIKISTITLPKYPVGDASSTPESQKKIADDLRTEILGGADFGTKAQHYSQDSHADQKGEWDWIERAQMDPQVAAAAFALKPGAVSKVVDVGAAYMLIMCNAKRPGDTAPLDKVRPDIERMLKGEKGREALNGWLVNLAKKATIEPAKVREGFIQHLSSAEQAE